jgi:undecaprenyl-diphosphatase
MTPMSLLQPGAPLVLAAHGCPQHMTYAEAGIVGIIQGVTELFPVSSLGHNVLLPALVGGCWAKNLSVAAPESPYLAFIVGLHVATALALLVYFWRDWVRIIKGFFTSLGQIIAPEAGTSRWDLRPDEKLAWLIILATIPVGLAGLAFERAFRVIFGKPAYAAVFLIINGLILIAGERFRRRSSLDADDEIAAEREYALQGGHGGQERYPRGQERYHPDDEQYYQEEERYHRSRQVHYQDEGSHGRYYRDEDDYGRYYPDEDAYGRGEGRHSSSRRAQRDEEIDNNAESDQRLAAMGAAQAVVIGSAQILALLAGISRDGVAMVGGMARGLSREDAARFAFLLATPVILAAGALKIPDLMGPLGSGIRGQVVLGSVLSGIGAYLAVRFLTRYFQTRTLTPFGIYCLVAGLGSLVYLQLIK